MKSHLRVHRSVLSLALGLLLAAPSLRAATRTWDGGGANGLITNPTNWVGDVAPINGNSDPLVFPSGVANRSVTNPAVGGLTGFYNLTFTGTNYSLSGAGGVIATGITNSSGGFATISVPLTLTAIQEFTAINPDSFLRFASPITIPGGLRLIAQAGSNCWLVFPGGLSGGGGVDFIGPGRAGFQGQGAVTLGGAVRVLANGSLFVSSPMAASELVLLDGSYANVSADLPAIRSTNSFVEVSLYPNVGQLHTADGPLLMNGGGCYFEVDGDGVSGLRVNGTVTLVNDVQLSVSGFPLTNGVSAFTIIENDGADPVSGTFHNLPEGAVLTGPGSGFRISYIGGDGNDVVLYNLAPPPATGLTKTWDGGGTDEFWSNSTNWFINLLPAPGDNVRFTSNGLPTVVTNDHPPGLALNRLDLRHSGIVLKGNLLRLVAGLWLTNETSIANVTEVLTPLEVLAPQTWDLHADADALFAALEVGNHTLTLRSDESALSAIPRVRIAGPITGTGEIFIASNSMVRIEGTNTFSGVARVANAGDLTIHQRATNLQAIAEGGGTLFLNNATVGSVEGKSNGTVQVIRRLFVQTNSSTVTGPLTLQPGATFMMTLSTNVQFAVQGAVTLSDALADLGCPDIGTLPGTKFTVINKQSAGPVLGTFAGVPEGAVLFSNNQYWRLSYVGGDGNDVTATLLSPFDSGLSRVWDGGMTGGPEDSLWSRQTNWVGNNAITTGDTLIFPVAASRKAHTNDAFFQPGTGAYALQFDGPFYDISLRENFPPMPLTYGVTANNNNTTNILRMPVVVFSNQTWNLASPTAVLRLMPRAGYLIGATNTVGAGDFIKTGPGRLDVFRLLFDHTGATIVNDGTLRLEDRAALTGPLQVNGGLVDAQLASAGGLTATAGVLRLGGHDVPLFNPVPADSLMVDSNVVLGAAVIFSPVATGTNLNFGIVGGTCGRLGFFKGTLHLNNAQLLLDLRYAPKFGDVLTIALDADTGGGNILGTFAGLPEGSQYKVGPFRFTVTYQGMGGRAVQLVTGIRDPQITNIELKEGNGLFDGIGEADRTVLVEYSDELVDWHTLAVVPVAANGTWSYSDPGAAALPKRFYRAWGL